MECDADPWEERAVRDAVLAGDAAAWRAWYDRHFARLAEYARWRCGGLPDLADDVIQETWLTAVRRLRAFDPARGSFFHWLCGLASNAARNAVRGRLRAGKRARPLDADHRAPEACPAAADRAERTAAALAALPERYEVVLRGKYLERRSVDEIAAANNWTPKAVESLLSRAREAFREAFAATGDP